MGGIEAWAEPVKLIGGALGIVLLGVAGFFQGKNKGAPAQAIDGEVVAATFTERAQMEALTKALTLVSAQVGQSVDITTELVGLLKAEAHRREVEAEVQERLRHERGLIR